MNKKKKKGRKGEKKNARGEAAFSGSNASVKTSPTRGNAIDNRVRCHRAGRVYSRITMELTLGEATRGRVTNTSLAPQPFSSHPLSLLVQDRIPPRDGRLSLSPSLSLRLCQLRPPPLRVGPCNHSCVNRIPPSVALELHDASHPRPINIPDQLFSRHPLYGSVVVPRAKRYHPAYVSSMRPPLSLSLSLFSRRKEES